MMFLKEFYQFLRERKKLWLIPILLVIVLIAALVVFAENSALSPFVYTLF